MLLTRLESSNTSTSIDQEGLQIYCITTIFSNRFICQARPKRVFFPLQFFISINTSYDFVCVCVCLGCEVLYVISMHYVIGQLINQTYLINCLKLVDSRSKGLNCIVSFSLNTLLLLNNDQQNKEKKYYKFPFTTMGEKV